MEAKKKIKQLLVKTGKLVNQVCHMEHLAKVLSTGTWMIENVPKEFMDRSAESARLRKKWLYMSEYLYCIELFYINNRDSVQMYNLVFAVNIVF